jgi:hypothetical protein
MLFLYTQTEKENVDKFAINFKSLWDMVEAFGDSPGVHKGLVNGLLATPGRVADLSNMTADKLIMAEVWECLTAVCKELSLANAKGKGIDGLVIRS